MRATSVENMQKCFERYVCNKDWGAKHSIRVIEIDGEAAKEGYDRIFSMPPFEYGVAPLIQNENTDNYYTLPYDRKSVDILVCGHVFAQTEFFWRLFKEMWRVLAPDGLIFLMTPSSDSASFDVPYCYAFQPKGYKALAKYVGCHLIDVWKDSRGPQGDFVGVFSRNRLPCWKHTEANQHPLHWGPNQYESETRPVVEFSKNQDLSKEIIQGKQPYLEVLKKLHALVKPKLYLETGVRKGSSLCLSAGRAIGIDPEPDVTVSLGPQHVIYELTSDIFFEFEAQALLPLESVDLAFIDGMHLFEYALRDFINIEKFSNSKTVVVVDDIFPNHVLQAARKRETRVWTGDIWKLVHCLKLWRPELKLTCLDTSPTGLQVITGLDVHNTSLEQNYNTIISHYRNMPLEGALAEKLISRRESIPSDDNQFWQWLTQFMNES